MSESRIKSYDEGKKDEREAILAWIRDNRSFIEFDAGDGIYRDHFTSENLILFIDSRS